MDDLQLSLALVKSIISAIFGNRISRVSPTLPRRCAYLPFMGIQIENSDREDRTRGSSAAPTNISVVIYGKSREDLFIDTVKKGGGMGEKEGNVREPGTRGDASRRAE